MATPACSARKPETARCVAVAGYPRKPADKRPVWFVRPDGSDAQALEPLRYQMSIDGSRALWKPWISKGMGTRE